MALERRKPAGPRCCHSPIQKERAHHDDRGGQVHTLRLPAQRGRRGQRDVRRRPAHGGRRSHPGRVVRAVARARRGGRRKAAADRAAGGPQGGDPGGRAGQRPARERAGWGWTAGLAAAAVLAIGVFSMRAPAGPVGPDRVRGLRDQRHGQWPPWQAAARPRVPSLRSLQAKGARMPAAEQIDFDKLRYTGCRTLNFAGHDVMEVCFASDGAVFHFYMARRDGPRRPGPGAHLRVGGRRFGGGLVRQPVRLRPGDHGRRGGPAQAALRGLQDWVAPQRGHCLPLQACTLRSIPMPSKTPNAEQVRLADDEARKRNWKRWGPYLSEREWGTVQGGLLLGWAELALLHPRACALQGLPLG